MQRLLTLILLLLPLAACGQQYPGGGGPYPSKAFSGTNINNGSIPLSKLSKRSEVSGQVAEWNGSSWVASDVQGVTIPNTISSNAPVLNTTYTNTSGSIQLVEGAFSLTTTGVVGQASADIYIDQAGGTAFVRHPISAVTSLLTSIAQSYTNTFSIAVSNNATWFLTNSSAGTGDSAALVTGSGQLITLADGAAAGVATLAGANVF